ncbi:Cytochrome P450 monooxygenase [Lachnellula subtilissima]|uniref:Cytochrome P450 monooxygenase n=1 Tax=Lachnellula subtilissima TaxID=602034 RepID=A0A8H8U893_9HELO|nr:Cytochrome P450 monooxygenase [Lachnellula subtilissima]
MRGLIQVCDRWRSTALYVVEIPSYDRESRTASSSFNLRARDSAMEQNSNTALVQMYHAVDSSDISEEQLQQTLDVILGGISWNLVFLTAYPETQARLRSEISAQRQRTTSEYNTYLTSSATCLASCISESSRLNPLAAFSVPQASPTGRCIGSYYFPVHKNI